jgi:hypothetical protein
VKMSKKAKRNGLRIAAGGVVLTSVAAQALILVYFWWDFDPRLSCDRLLYWNEWITCLHGTSHLYILTAESAVAVWVVAGIGTALGRFLPPYISILLPVGMAVVLILYLIGYWQLDFRPRAEPILSVWDIFNFSVTAGALAVFLVGPVAGAWLWGLFSRRHRRLLRLSTVF